MYVRIKVCGVTTPAAAREAARAGVDAIGVVLSPSPRQLTLAGAREVMDAIPPFVTRVAVFHQPEVEDVEAAVAALQPDVVQTEMRPELAAVRTRVRVLPVVHDHPRLIEDLSNAAPPSATTGLLLEADGRGGRGVAPDWDRAARIARDRPLILAGGLTPGNVADALRLVRPHGVDVSSGVESAPGEKDPVLVARFVRQVRETCRRMTPAPGLFA